MDERAQRTRSAKINLVGGTGCSRSTNFLINEGGHECQLIDAPLMARLRGPRVQCSSSSNLGQQKRCVRRLLSLVSGIIRKDFLVSVRPKLSAPLCQSEYKCGDYLPQKRRFRGARGPPMIQVTTHFAMITEPTNHVTLNISVGNLLKAVQYAEEAETFTDDIALISINGELLQPPYTPFQREITNEMAALLVLDRFEE